MLTVLILINAPGMSHFMKGALFRAHKVLGGSLFKTVSRLMGTVPDILPQMVFVVMKKLSLILSAFF